MKKTFLIISLSNIGDVVLTTPVISSIKANYPDAFLKVVVGPKAKAMLEGSVCIDELIVYDKHNSWSEKVKFVLDLKKEKYQAVIDLRNTAIPFLLNAKNRSPLFRKYNGGGMRKKHLDVLVKTLPQISNRSNQFDFFTDAECESAFLKLKEQGFVRKDYVVFSAGSASEAKRWPEVKYRELSQIILAKTTFDIILIGDQKERNDIRKIHEVNPQRIFNMAGMLSLRESASVIHDAEVLVTNDSAAMHIGHELDQNVVALFGPSDFEKYGRTGKHFKALCSQPSSENLYFQDINPEEVFNVLAELLSEQKSGLSL